MSIETITNTHYSLKMTREEFHKFRELVYTHTHIFCVDSQKPIFERKIRLQVAALNLSSFQEYYTFVTESEGRKQELTRLIDAIAVHETSFFRISGHFKGLETLVFPALFQNLNAGKTTDIRIWSAGCSTGEEPYSIAITFLKTLTNYSPKPSKPRRMRILATDISPLVIQKAQEGIYSPSRVQKIPKPLLDKYFESRHHHYYITQQVKHFVHFQVFNLINLEALPAQKFDIIFCRNLLIYFDRSAQKDLIAGLIKLLSEGGYLFLGDTESVHTFPESARRLAFVESGNALIYRKRGVETS